MLQSPLLRQVMYEISQRFFFDAAHTLARDMERDASLRVHGHTYHAEITLRGQRDVASGMVRDLGLLREDVAFLRAKLDHRMLNDIPGLEVPTLENLCAFIAQELAHLTPALAKVRVWREGMGDACTWYP
jgi:6-pyruvoyltetrahydropterin/6-carboxytetrahydropterin synthase